MTEIAEIPPAGAAAPPVTATPGQRLKAARERRGLSSQKAADKMHLDPWVIEALEADQLDKIGPSVYAKGHLKHYAAMLGVPPADIVAAYGESPATAAAPRGGMNLRTQEPVGIELPWATIAAAAIAAVVIAGVVWLRPWRPRNPAAAVPPLAAQSALDAASVPSAPESPIDDAENVSLPAVQERPATAAKAPTAVAVAEQAPAAVAASAGGGKAQLRLSFSADSWVEVHDASGKAVFAGNGRANSVKTLGGDAPLRVYLRSASGVQLAINNHVVAIGPQFVAGDVARFEAGADGVLRRYTHEPRPHG